MYQLLYYDNILQTDTGAIWKKRERKTAAIHNFLSNMEVNNQDFSDERLLEAGRRILEDESTALTQMAQRLDESFCQAISLIDQCVGNVLVCGMGKAGLVGQKVMATMGSLGIRSHFLHPAEAVHGDLGRVRSDDCMLMFSQSGETEEITRLLPALKEMGVPIIAVTGSANSALARSATVVLDLHSPHEACPMGLAPSTSTTMMLALGDALALTLSAKRHFSPVDFAKNHPAGSLGKALSKVDSIMRPLERCRLANDSLSIRQVFVDTMLPGRRTGAIMLVNSDGALTGVFTDSDLARLFEQGEVPLDKPISSYMTKRPWAMRSESMAMDAIDLMSDCKISELPIIDANGRPVGLVDITDVPGFFSKMYCVKSQNVSNDMAQDNSPNLLIKLYTPQEKKSA